MQEVINQMKQLEISMAGEMKPFDQVQVKVQKRIIQVRGDLYEYNPLEDTNILRVKDVFLCLD
jgi:hypothetical protein